MYLLQEYYVLLYTMKLISIKVAFGLRLQLNSFFWDCLNGFEHT